MENKSTYCILLSKAVTHSTSFSNHRYEINMIKIAYFNSSLYLNNIHSFFSPNTSVTTSASSTNSTQLEVSQNPDSSIVRRAAPDSESSANSTEATTPQNATSSATTPHLQPNKDTAPDLKSSADSVEVDVPQNLPSSLPTSQLQLSENAAPGSESSANSTQLSARQNITSSTVLPRVQDSKDDDTQLNKDAMAETVDNLTHIPTLPHAKTQKKDDLVQQETVINLEDELVGPKTQDSVGATASLDDDDDEVTLNKPLDLDIVKQGENSDDSSSHTLQDTVDLNMSDSAAAFLQHEEALKNYLGSDYVDSRQQRDESSYSIDEAHNTPGSYQTVRRSRRFNSPAQFKNKLSVKKEK